MRYVRIFPVIVLMALLTACNTETPQTNSTQTSAYTDEAFSSFQSDHTYTEEDGGDQSEKLVGYGGERLEREYFEEKPDSVLLYYNTDYGYTASFDGKIYNSYDNPDKFDLERWECTEYCEAASSGFFIINEGDRFNNLTCTYAAASYCIETRYHDYLILTGASTYFEGEAEVTGYIDRCDGNEGYVEEGELLFYPDGESWQGLPIPCEPSYFTYASESGGLIYAPFKISLGVVDDYSHLGLDSDIPQGSTVHMKLTIKDIRLVYKNAEYNGYAPSTAVIVSAEKTD